MTQGRTPAEILAHEEVACWLVEIFIYLLAILFFLSMLGLPQ